VVRCLPISQYLTMWRFLLREHTKLSEGIIRTHRFVEVRSVGLRGAAALMPMELSGWHGQTGALARALRWIPDMILMDEPFAGQDPISMGVLLKLI